MPLWARCLLGGAYEALKKLQGVEMVRPIANADDSTAEVYLSSQSLPDLRCWPEQFAQWANRSYDFRGVEVTLSGTVREQDRSLVLISPSGSDPYGWRRSGRHEDSVEPPGADATRGHGRGDECL